MLKVYTSILKLSEEHCNVWAKGLPWECNGLHLPNYKQIPYNSLFPLLAFDS